MGAAVFFVAGARASGVKKWLVAGGGGLGRRPLPQAFFDTRSPRGTAAGEKVAVRKWGVKDWI